MIMKVISNCLLLAVMWLTISCTEETSSVKFDDIKLSETKSLIEVSILTIDGFEVEANRLQSNQVYRLQLKSNAPFGLKFRQVDGFDFVSVEKSIFSLSPRKSYEIKTHDGVQSIFFSVIPIIKDELGELKKERAQLFLIGSGND